KLGGAQAAQALGDVFSFVVQQGVDIMSGPNHRQFQQIQDAQRADVRARIQALQDEARRMGQTPIPLRFTQFGPGTESGASTANPFARGAFGQGLNQDALARWAKQLEEQLAPIRAARARDLSESQDLLTQVLNLGDHIPDSLRGAIDSLWKMGSITKDIH